MVLESPLFPEFAVRRADEEQEEKEEKTSAPEPHSVRHAQDMLQSRNVMMCVEVNMK